MLAIIGGSGLDTLPGLEDAQAETVGTPFGEVTLMRGSLHGAELVFLPRHGEAHHLAPHQINYRANIWALHEAGVREVIGVAAVGAISRHMPPASLVAVHDLIDYSWGRAHSFSGESGQGVLHVEFATPFSSRLRGALIDAAMACPELPFVAEGVYGVTQGPRLETIAEIRRMRQDGCDVVGMTLMPEAGLAAEIGLDYASLCVVVNWAAGVGTGSVHADIEQHMSDGIAGARRVLGTLVEARLSESRR